MIRSLACSLPLLLLGCGGAPFVAGELLLDSGAADSEPPQTIDDSGAGDAGSPARAAAPPPMLDAGVDAPAPIAPPDSGDVIDAGPPPLDSGADAGPPLDPVTYACGSKSADGTTPVAASLQWWASVSVPHGDGGYTEDYCTVMSLGPGAATFPYTCEGLAAVWTCSGWQATGGALGCHPSALDSSVLQVDCWIP